MAFNSLEFIALFLPIVIACYHLLKRFNYTYASRCWLILASLFFYAWWNVKFLPVLIASIFINYFAGLLMQQHITQVRGRKVVLFAGLAFNILLLGYFKYLGFIAANVNSLFGTGIHIAEIALPLAISFFTFQQISYLVESYRHSLADHQLIDYVNFVTFFPKLTAGPLADFNDLSGQFRSGKRGGIDSESLCSGLFIFVIGLAKKVIIADAFSFYVSYGFDKSSVLTFVEAWIISISYTLQLYFDFSGYTDMAIGIARMMGITLPVNFNSPYTSLNIREFWRRWHITLGAFLSRYIYIPLGGSRTSTLMTYRNLLITFFICGLWHGAGWTFIIWGMLHGGALVLHRIWSAGRIKMNKYFAWFLTFNVVNFCWIFFRAKEFKDAIKVIKGMLFMNGIILPRALQGYSFLQRSYVQFDFPTKNIGGDLKLALVLFLSFFLSILFKNSQELTENFKFNYKTAAIVASLGFLSLISIISQELTSFIYVNF